jgi:CRISPR/Cas system-associated exonuclease Cas4 (RecB family)
MTTALTRNTRLRTRTLESVPHKTTRHDQPHLSYSQLKSYAGCSLAWRLSRTHRPEHVSAALVFGSAFHAAAEKLYQARLEGNTATHRELMDAYQAVWTKHFDATDGREPAPIRYSAKSDLPTLHQTASRMLEAFLIHAEQNMGEVIAVEEPFEIELAPDLPVLKGRIDLIEIRTGTSGNRYLHLADFKTAAKRMDEGDLDRDQLALYAAAARKTGLLEQIGLPLILRVDVILKTKTAEVIPITVSPDRANEARVVAKARQIWKAMSAGVCYPAPGFQCANCGYRTLCGKWPDIEEV